MKSALREAIVILGCALLFGLAVNAFHPRRAPLSFRRPSADSNLVADLPGLNVAQGGPFRIGTSQVRRLLDQGRALLLDARDPGQYAKGHIPGAINVPYEKPGEAESAIENLPEDKVLICHCEGPPCDLGELLAWELTSRGLEGVAVYHEGINAWLESGGELDLGKGGER